jgi:DegV family protein with EDD domain
MAEAILCFLGQDLAAAGESAASIAETLRTRANDLRMAVSLETLEYLKRGGRISGAQAAIGTLLSVKPIIAVEHGVVETADKPRTRSKSRERCIEILCERPIERISILHTMAPDVDAFRDEVVRRGGAVPVRRLTLRASSAWRTNRPPRVTGCRHAR